MVDNALGAACREAVGSVDPGYPIDLDWMAALGADLVRSAPSDAPSVEPPNWKLLNDSSGGEGI